MLRRTLLSSSYRRVSLPVPIRFASTVASPPSVLSRIRSVIVSTVVLLSIGGAVVYTQDSSAGIHRWLFLPLVGLYTADDPEKAHEIAVTLIGSGLAPKDRGMDDESLAIEIWGRRHANPLGMAAGFDKHGEAIDGLFDLGFGYVEIGSITPEAQPGNPKPRVFRIPDSNALVNRYGFNSEGHLSAIGRLRTRVHHFIASHALTLPASIFPSPPPTALPDHDVVAQLLASPEGKEAVVIDRLHLPRSLRDGKVLAINLGKNKTSAAESNDDFIKGVESLGPYADILVVNVSSPNTPGLRDLQRKGVLEELLRGVVEARDALSSSWKPPVLVKVAPDLDAAQLEDIAHAVLSTGIDGIIVSNTTISRPATAGTSSSLLEAGGLSGPPLKPLSLAALSSLYIATEGKVPLIGCGGISSGAEAIEFAKAGASLVQLYTAFIYGGVGLPRKIKDEMMEILKKEGKNWKDIIGSGITFPPKAVAVETVAIEAGHQSSGLLSDEELLASMGDLVAHHPPPEIVEEDHTISASISAELEELLSSLVHPPLPTTPSTFNDSSISPSSADLTPFETPAVSTSESQLVAPIEENTAEEVIPVNKAYPKRDV